MVENILGKIIIPVIILGVLFILYKKGVLKSLPLPTLGFSFQKGRRTLKAKYSHFRDSRVYNYMPKKDVPVIFHYDVTVQEGNLRLEVRSTDGSLLKKTFSESEKDSIEWCPKSRLHSIVLNGENAIGECHCAFEKKR